MTEKTTQSNGKLKKPKKPPRKKNYSTETRQIVINKRYTSGMSITKIVEESKANPGLFGNTENRPLSRSTVKNILRTYEREGRIEALPKGGRNPKASPQSGAKGPALDAFIRENRAALGPFTQEILQQIDDLNDRKFEGLPSNWKSSELHERTHIIQTIIKPVFCREINESFEDILNGSAFKSINSIRCKVNDDYGTHLSPGAIVTCIERPFYSILKSQPNERAAENRTTNYRSFLEETKDSPPERIIFIREHLYQADLWSKTPTCGKVTHLVFCLAFAFTRSGDHLATSYQDHRLNPDNWLDFLSPLLKDLPEPSTFVFFDKKLYNSDPVVSLLNDAGHSLRFLYNEETFGEALNSAVKQPERYQEAQNEESFKKLVQKLAEDKQLIDWTDWCKTLLEEIENSLKGNGS